MKSTNICVIYQPHYSLHECYQQIQKLKTTIGANIKLYVSTDYYNDQEGFQDIVTYRRYDMIMYQFALQGNTIVMQPSIILEVSKFLNVAGVLKCIQYVMDQQHDFHVLVYYLAVIVFCKPSKLEFKSFQDDGFKPLLPYYLKKPEYKLGQLQIKTPGFYLMMSALVFKATPEFNKIFKEVTGTDFISWRGMSKALNFGSIKQPYVEFYSLIKQLKDRGVVVRQEFLDQYGLMLKIQVTELSGYPNIETGKVTIYLEEYI